MVDDVYKVHEIKDIVVIIENIFSIAIRLAGVAAFIMFIVGGFKYLTAGGDPKAAESAKGTLTYAIFGLVLIIAVWFILRFISEFTGVTQILEFEFNP